VQTVHPELLALQAQPDHKDLKAILLLSTLFNFSVALVNLALKVSGPGCPLGT
jgi:methylglyoxal synthase